MRKGISLFRLIEWLIFSIIGFIVIGNFISFLIRDLKLGVDLFWPGIIVIFLVAILFTVFSVTRVIKYFKILTSKE